MPASSGALHVKRFTPGLLSSSTEYSKLLILRPEYYPTVPPYQNADLCASFGRSAGRRTSMHEDRSCKSRV